MSEEEKEVIDVEMNDDEVRVNYGSGRTNHRVFKKIRAIIPLFCVIVFLSIGLFVENSWGKAWLVFLLIPLSEVILSIINSSKKKMVMGIAFILIIITYVLLGFFLPSFGVTHSWLKALIVFILYPIICIIVD